MSKVDDVLNDLIAKSEQLPLTASINELFNRFRELARSNF
jgi:hypothetical protein